MENTKLWPSNPYVNGFVYQFTNGDTRLLKDPLIYQPSSGDKYHTITEDETLSSLAYEYYGDSKYYHIIAEVNNITFPLDLTIGTVIIIPDLTNTLTINSQM